MVESETRIKRLQDVFFLKGCGKKTAGSLETWTQRTWKKSVWEQVLLFLAIFMIASNYKNGPQTYSCLLFTTTIIKCLLLLRYWLIFINYRLSACIREKIVFKWIEYIDSTSGKMTRKTISLFNYLS